MPDYVDIVRKMRCKHRVRVRKWRSGMSGCAWQVRYQDGRVIRWIESPLPRGSLSLAIFLHEIGHHVIGFERHKHRCEEEYYVWQWALSEMRRIGIEPDARVQNRFRLSMCYAVDKAMRRGLKRLPPVLKEFETSVAPPLEAPLQL